MKKILQRSLLVLGSLTLVILLLGLTFVWRSPAYYTAYGTVDLPVQVMTSEEYDKVIQTHPRPYIVTIDLPQSGALLLYGSQHTRDPGDPQFGDMKQRWDAFRPDVALVEGRLGFLIPGFMDPVEQFGESGAVYGWARKAGIDAYTWEPKRAQEVTMLVKEFPRERVALYYSLRPYFGDVRFGKPGNPDERIESYIASRTDYPELKGLLHTAADVDALWRKDFADLPDWRDTDDKNGFPGYLRDISQRVNRLRDEHVARSAINLVRKGHRVFVVAGASHAVMLEPALRGALSGR